MDFFTDLADAIHFHRHQAKLSRNALAQLAGVGKTAIYDIEHAKPTVRLDTLVKVARVLNVQLTLTGPLMSAWRAQRHA